VTPTPEDRRAIDLALAEWLAKLGNDGGEHHRPAFEAWLAERREHRDAYRAFEAVDHDVLQTSLPIPPLHRQTRPAIRPSLAYAAIAALLVLGVGGGGTLLFLRSPSREAATGTLYAAGDTARAVDLPDGTSLMLDAHAMILTSIEEEKPLLLLEQGRARIRLPASTNRPFTVASGDLRLTAHGAVFDIAKDGNTVRVIPLGGKVIVRHVRQPEQPPLLPGQQLVAGPDGDKVMTADKSEPGWTSALLPLDGKTLGDLVTIGNRTGGKMIAFADSALASRPVQGQLPVKDTHLLALQIAAAFDLDIRETHDEYILTRKT
jgi:transmembrane sensor